MCAILRFLGFFLTAAGGVPSIVGRSIRSWGVNVEIGCEFVTVAVLAFQALWYPVVLPVDEDEDSTSR